VANIYAMTEYPMFFSILHIMEMFVIFNAFTTYFVCKLFVSVSFIEVTFLRRFQLVKPLMNSVPLSSSANLLENLVDYSLTEVCYTT